MQPQDQPAQTSQPTPATAVGNPLAAMREGEQIICEIKRHPIGIVGTYIGATLLFVLLALVGYLAIPSAVADYSTSKVYNYVTGGLLILLVIELLYVWIVNIVYRGNRWIVTSDSITQVTQTGLFAKRNSQLSMGNLEDITAEQNGILPSMFNYGILKAETAGEHSKFRFLYCPNPNYYAQCILKAREAFEQEGGYGAHQRGGFRPPTNKS